MWRSVQRMGWIGVKSRFLNSSLGEPIFFFPIKNQEVGAPNKSQRIIEFACARGADLLVQCCYLAGEEIVDDDLRLIADHVLASSTTVGRIAARAGVKRLALVHIKEKSDELLRSMAEEIGRDFDGEVIVGEDLMEIEV